jgi:tetratricopeptide (TPR) repeat protein
MTDLVGRRLARLPLGAAKILVTAAALGRTFNLCLLTEASGASYDDVLDAIDAGLEASVLETTTQDDGMYQFAHPLLVDAMMKSVSPARRRVTHERIALILVAKDVDDAGRIAAHFAHSGRSNEAYAWGVRAATRAMSIYSLDEAVGMLELALAHATTDDERASVHGQLAHAAEHSGRWGDVERSCDAILATSVVAGDVARALPVRLRRLQARVRLGQGAEDTRAECHALLEVATRIGQLADVVQARSLLVQILGRAGDIDDATRVAAASLVIAQQAGDDALYDEALHRLAITQFDSELDEAIGHLIELIERAHGRGDKVIEARAWLSLGVARMRHGDESAAAEAFRSSLALAREASALDFAATASMNLGVLQLRAGEHSASRVSLTDALRLYTTLRNNTYRTAALYNLANLEREAGDASAALGLYREVAAVAPSLGADDIAIGAYAGIGWSALRLADPLTARSALESARALMGDRDDWWFQGRELLESLAIRTAAMEGDRVRAAARFTAAVARLETIDPYAAAWLVCDSAAELAEDSEELWPIAERLSRDATIQQFAPLCARFTALRNVAERIEITKRRAAGPS